MDTFALFFLAQSILMKEFRNYSLIPYHTFGMDVKADLLIEYSSVNELKQVITQYDLTHTRWLHIGSGSNLLFTDDYHGIVLHSAIRGYELIHETANEVWVCAGAGEVWDDFVAFSVRNQWFGAENLSLIPGEVGASAVQNIGAYGIEAKDLIISVETIEVSTGKERTFCVNECGYAYRESVFKKELKGKFIVTHVTYKLSKQPGFHLAYGNVRAELEKRGEEPTLELVRQTIINIREAKLPDPKVQGNAGSFFMNPVISRQQYENLLKDFPDMPHYDIDNEQVKVPAAWMIDRCGWKGKAMGRAGVHDKQALVLVNLGGATGSEVIELSKAIQSSVFERFGVNINPEVNFITNE